MIGHRILKLLWVRDVGEGISLVANIHNRKSLFDTLFLETREQRCCTPDAPCEEGEGDCDSDSECMFGLKCGDNNCKQYGQYYHKKDDCCEPGMYGC